MGGRKSRRIKISVVAAVFLFVSFIALSGENDFNVIDTPKTYMSYRGDMHFDFTMYDGGGVLGSATLSISDFIFLGIYFDVGNLIGSNELEWNQPGVLARFLISDGSGTVPPIAVGYSYFMKGGVSKVNGTLVNGIYAVSTQTYFLFGNQQQLYYGMRYPIVPLSYSKVKNLSLFVATDLILSPQFSVKGEIENIFFDKDRWDEIYYNIAFSMNIVDLITLSLEIKYSPSIDRFVRLLSIGYITQF